MSDTKKDIMSIVVPPAAGPKFGGGKKAHMPKAGKREKKMHMHDRSKGR